MPISWAVALFLGFLGIQAAWVMLLNRGQLFQPIYEDSPQTHQKKVRTPSLGGVGIWACLALGLYLRQLFSPEVLWLFFGILGFAFIGLWDDVSALKRGKNKGLTAKQKFFFQWVVAGVWVLAHHIFITNLPIWQIVFFSGVAVGASNATNLTDGVDGLLGSLSLISLAGFWVVLSSFHSSILVLGLSIGAFLVLNWHPAKVFMGDTGSLGIGAALTGYAILYQNVWILLPFGFVYILETLSVMIQVAWYKRTQKRIFLMSPLHHHFELMGMPEVGVVAVMGMLQVMGVGLKLWLQ